MNIYDHAHALSKAIKASPEYKKFKMAKEKLENDSSAREMLNDFRKAQLEIQKQRISGKEVEPQQEERLKQLMDIIKLNLIIKEYLEAEYRFSVMLADIQKIIGEAMEDLLPPALVSNQE